MSLHPALVIVLCTLAMRLLISPLGYLQARADHRRRSLAPRIDALRAEHPDDPLALAAGTLAVQRAHGAGPMATLLPALAQAPFFLIMYRMALSPPAGALLGVPLGAHLTAGLPVFALLLAVSAVLAWWLGRQADGPAWLRVLPWLSVAALAWMPLGGALYLVTSTAWTVLERMVWRALL